MKRILTGVAAVALAAATLGAQQTVQINGAGATFPAPIYTKWFSEYNKLHSNIQINYQPVGSGAGIQQVMSAHGVLRRLRRADDTGPVAGGAGQVMHFPTVLGAVVPIYNVPGVSQPLTFTGPVLADIFLGKINKWNDPAIEKLNPGVTLPHADIAVAHRSDGSGTTYIWCDYLAKVSPEWKQKVGIATSVQVADRDCRGAQRRRRRHRLADAWRDRIRRAGVRAAEQDQLRQRPEHERKSA